MRQGLDVIRNFCRLFSEFLHTASHLRRIFLELFEFDCQHCESLVYVVVKLSPDPGTFLLLRLDQFPRHLRKSLFRFFAFGNV